ITKSEEDKEIIAAANKKITDSINYAKRIQSSILPDTALLQTIFPDSFVMFKPKDIVSGDFPWILKTENGVFVAAVDCTGHGVPGALISLIGYFLLSNIFSVEENKKLKPSEILDILDESVVRTLRQTEDDAISKDGMDVSLCKINFDTKTLEYAGAHRPLYYVDTHKPEIEDPLEEIKGDKMPVGGGQYKNRGAFTNHERPYQEGDMIVLFSDGLPDQFGGPDNRKFSPKRIRDIIKANLNAPMITLNDALENELRMWMRLDDEKNATKQTDDILVIGIRF
ncbi:MAG: SpoIIE family protein phosphatase, partial [Raineya sp.]|nr:SpoIIE family protein phosphatase [Raineya sp.]